MAWLYIFAVISVLFKIYVIGDLMVIAAQPPCHVYCTPNTYSSDNALYEDNDGSPIPVGVVQCNIRSFHSFSCATDITECLNPKANKDVMVLLSLTCSEPLQIIFSSCNSIKRRNVWTSLFISGPCTIFLNQTISVVAQAVLLKFVEIFDGTQLLVHQEANTNADLESIETFRILTKQIKYKEVMTLFTSKIWPHMIYFQLKNVHLENGIVQRLKYTMPLLQSLILENDNLKVPPLFPWNNGTLFTRWTRTEGYNKNYFFIRLPRNIYVRQLDLENNNIQDLENYNFRGPLHVLSLRGNLLRAIGCSSFKRLTGLLALNLGVNRLNRLPKELFTGLTSLVYLGLDHNDLYDLHDGTFKDLTKLKNLYLNNNNIARIQRNHLRYLTNLEVLHLESNQIRFVDRHLLPGDLPNLREIYLQNNKITHVPSWTLVLNSLELLDMSHNAITQNSLFQAFNSTDENSMFTLEVSALQYHNNNHKWKFRSFKLVGNYINTFDVFGLSSLNKWRYIALLDLYIFDLTNNSIKCDCSTIDAARKLNMFIKQSEWRSKKPYRNWTCTNPSNFAGLNILSILTKNVQCRLNSSKCSEPCQCYQRPQDNAVVVDCRNRNLTRMPAIIPNPLPAKLLELHLEGNNISKLVLKSFLRNVTSLYLSHNFISIISAEFLAMLSNIRELYINNNNIERLPKSIQHITFEKLSLKQNLFQCTCRELWLKKWLHNISSVVVDVSKIRCTSGLGKGKTLTLVRDQDFQCLDKHTSVAQNDTYKTLAYALAAIFGIVFLASVIIYKFRGEIKVLAYARLHFHPFDRFDNNEGNDEIIYDAFVSYSQHDSRWVIEVLKERLETNDPPFKLCIHDRDFLGGSTIQENILTSVRQSKRMLLILSRNFIRSEWCLLEFRAAHHRVLQGRYNYLIVVLLDDISIEEVDDELKLYMRTNTYLSVQNRWFWQQLLYALPRNHIRVEQAPHLEVQEQEHQNLGQHEGDVAMAEIQE